MSDHDLTPEEYQIAELTAKNSGRRYPGVDIDDVYQELWVWILEHWGKVQQWRTEDSRGLGKFKRAMRNAAYDFCESDRVADQGADPEDHYAYSRERVRVLLPEALQTEWHWPPGKGFSPDKGSGGDPAIGNDRLAELVDVRDAFRVALTDAGKWLIDMAVDLDFDYMAIAESLEDRAKLEGVEDFSVSADAARERVSYHLDRMRKHLGGPEPDDPDKEYTGQREVLSAAQAQAIYTRQYGG